MTREPQVRITGTTPREKIRESKNRLWLVKAIALSCFGVALSFLSVKYFYAFFTLGGSGAFSLGFISAFLFLAVSLLQSLFIRNPFLICLSAAAAAFLPISIFRDKLSSPVTSIGLAVGAGLFSLFLAAGIGRGQGVLKNGVKIKFFLIARSVMPKALSGLILFLTVIFHFVYFEWGGLTEENARRALYGLLDSASPVVSVILPGVSLNASIDDFLAKFAENQFERFASSILPAGSLPEGLDASALGAGDLNDKLSENLTGRLTKQEIARQISLSLREDLLHISGPIKSGATVKEVFFQVVKKFTNDFSRQNPQLVPIMGIGASIIVFFSVKSMSFIISWGVAVFSFIVYKVLMVARFARIEEKQAVKEEIVV